MHSQILEKLTILHKTASNKKPIMAKKLLYLVQDNTLTLKWQIILSEY